MRRKNRPSGRFFFAYSHARPYAGGPPETYRTMNQKSPTISCQISPPHRRYGEAATGMDVLSREELTRLRDISKGGLHETLRRCALAVLTTGTESDDPRAAQVRYPDFDIEVLQLDRGIKLDLKNAPASAFVDGQLIYS